MSSQSFGSENRLRKAPEFNRVFKQGKRFSSAVLTIVLRFYKGSDQVKLPRLGLSVSKKMGGAPQRNLIKRRIREIFRVNKHKIKKNSEIIVIPRKEALEIGYNNLEKQIVSLFSRANMLEIVEK